ncbi:nucleoside triphosphate pyrophosphohydrolase [Natronobacterium texcoconense]|uniref:Predicted house-cleaning noncanonical NTP pyrophosphatase, all-alpha NTP-PPase (MazG) superfamily n=1 Tax=Natronobacterium texcoconense TaxID=1095778 RepID=A0A1H1FIL2_NATTX|nr:nucleoside triphosphate pyrophosphohydrolase [Natronobacterium texcoconense]SDR00765.1 Predicted house-cleaning noncanonical NTP pyrophosphatase, all-alpha NTP-PPase (MazG) superfamily [Natronobacterium texcoconense]
MPREYDKLVRDDIPEIIERDGETPVVHTADDNEYGRRLLEKLDEEVTEFRESEEIEELADVLEVVHAIRAHEGVSRERLEDLRSEKAQERGRFEERIVLERVE